MYVYLCTSVYKCVCVCIYSFFSTARNERETSDKRTETWGKGIETGDGRSSYKEKVRGVPTGSPRQRG